MVFVNISGRVKDYYASEWEDNEPDDWCDEPPAWSDGDDIPVNFMGEENE